jgi:hypothetical protein
LGETFRFFIAQTKIKRLIQKKRKGQAFRFNLFLAKRPKKVFSLQSFSLKFVIKAKLTIVQ